MDSFNAHLHSPWQAQEPPKASYRPDFADDEQLKNAFGIALARGLSSYDAGQELFNNDLPKVLWASLNWVNDPIVQAAKDAYKVSFKRAQKPLDKEELLAEVLEKARSSFEDKDSVAFFKLYSEIAGFTGKHIVDNSVHTNNDNSNNVRITLVGGNEKTKVIDQAPNAKSKMLNDETPLPQLKLVSGAGR